MKISIWRYSHFILAISSSLFILLASVTGIILAFEPIEEQLSQKTTNISNISIAETIGNLQNKDLEVVSITVNHHNQVKANVVTKTGESKSVFVDPSTGESLGVSEKRHSIYKFTTTLHRSLFLKSTGRILVGVFSFILFIICITGLAIVVKKEGGIKNWFFINKTESFNQKYHSLFGKYALVPIVIITCSGVYLSLDKFNILPKNKLNNNVPSVQSQTKKLPSITDAIILKETPLNQLVKLEFPFSKDEEDYFYIKLKDKAFYLHQFTGVVIRSQSNSNFNAIKYWSIKLHTGQGYIVWSMVLMLSCFAILFFMFSGFKISYNRLLEKEKVSNTYNHKNAEIILLVGSETGSTMALAKCFHNALLKENQKSYLTSINKIQHFPEAKHIVLLSATYGDGDPPANATKFYKRIQQFPFSPSVYFSVVGFGSLAYQKYCEFAIQIDDYLAENNIGKSFLPLTKINNKSFTGFKAWQEKWAKKMDLNLEMTPPKLNRKKQKNYTVTQKSELNIDETFTIRLKPENNQNFESGDLLSVVPENNNVERLYSIGKVEGEIILSIKKHDFGICSNLLFNLNVGASIKAGIHRNKNFHLPRGKRSTIFIANGTGIAPFIGMMHSEKHSGEKHLFWGCKTRQSTQIYDDVLAGAKGVSKHMAYSREGDKTYVQDLLIKSPELISLTLSTGGTIMICGSIAMMNGVLEVLDHISKKQLNKPISYYKEKGKIMLDCY